MTSRIEISHRTIIFTVFFLIGLWLILKIKDILFLLFIAFILMSALRPLVDWLEKFKIPRVISIILIYALAIVFFVISFAEVIPSLIYQTTRLITQMPIFLTKVVPSLGIDIKSLTAQIAPISENIVNLTLGIFSNIFTTMTILILTFYFLLERNHTENFLVNFIGEESAKRAISVVSLIEKRLGAWVASELFLMTVIGVFSYIGLTLLRVDFALPLAIIAGLLEAVPMIGPIISAIPAILVGLASSPVLAFSVIALYVIIQQVENNIIIPIVMKRGVGISPILTILALLVGGRLGGIGGAILAIPGVLVLEIILQEFLFKTTKEPTKNRL